ncbi:TetR/AcrR family transcriptional regulator [Kineosporia sp. J2-2]|uniref:TetR/AcrR family transcriptional regulator n=1 Tax=Kineosporia corallincola TaxID=2835133 RepID=A0ABS5TSA2_9ACTN|nr:TetR/AcrR family transcriptional regulator [Kineosporia corallincola]MBT0773689.1 TetR/AcrR family transcriptional regulator [Kineosporia corallincola]
MSKERRENPIVTRSRAALIAAATALLDERGAAEISVKDVVETAGMSRPTFYQHFPDLGAVFAAAGLARLEQTLGDLEQPTQAPSGLEHAFAPTVAAVAGRMKQHAVFFHRVHAGPGYAAYHAGVVAFTAARLRSEPLLQPWAEQDDVFWEFLAAGTVWVINRQLAAWCAGRPEPGSDLSGIFALLLTTETTRTTES